MLLRQRVVRLQGCLNCVPRRVQSEPESAEVVDDEEALSRRAHRVASCPVGLRKVTPPSPRVIVPGLVCDARCLYVVLFHAVGR